MKKNYITLKSIAFINKVFILFILISISNNVYAQNSDCSATLEVLKNRDTKFAGVSGTSYKFIVKNNSNQSDTYIVSVENIDINSESNFRSGNNSNARNVSLPNSIVFGNNKLNNSSEKKDFKNSLSPKSMQIDLNPNEEIMLLVKLEVPLGTEIGSKNINQVTLVSKNCKATKIVKQVYTEVVDGE